MKSLSEDCITTDLVWFGIVSLYKRGLFRFTTGHIIRRWTTHGWLNICCIILREASLHLPLPWVMSELLNLSTLSELCSATQRVFTRQDKSLIYTPKRAARPPLDILISLVRQGGYGGIMIIVGDWKSGDPAVGFTWTIYKSWIRLGARRGIVVWRVDQEGYFVSVHGPLQCRKWRLLKTTFRMIKNKHIRNIFLLDNNIMDMDLTGVRSEHYHTTTNSTSLWWRGIDVAIWTTREWLYVGSRYTYIAVFWLPNHNSQIYIYQERRQFIYK